MNEVCNKPALIECEVPLGVNLLNDRVGFTTSNGNDLNVGETVTFKYAGGSEFGTRTVLILKIDAKHIEGLTLERDGEYRSYIRGQMERNVNGHLYTVVEPFVKQEAKQESNDQRRIRFDDAATALVASLTGEQLAELYGKYGTVEGKNARFDAVTGEVVVDLPKPKVNSVENVQSCQLTFKNKRERCLTLFLYTYSGQIGFHNYEDGTDNSNASPDQLRDELVKFLA